jgi:hypothetical protein
MWYIYIVDQDYYDGDDEWKAVTAVNSFYVALDVQQYNEYVLGIPCRIEG